MINLVLDTTCLRNDPARKKSAFRALKKLCDTKRVKLHISQVVVQEFLSQQIEKHSVRISKITTESAKFQRMHIPDEVEKYMHGVIQRMNKLKEELAQFVQADFNDWMTDLCVELHPILQSHGQKVMDAYFSGDSPFRGRKRREDIPDGFVWQTIIDLARISSPIYVISSDGAMKNASKCIPDIITFDTLDEFITSNVCQTPLRDAYAVSNFGGIVSIQPGIIDEAKRVIISDAIDALHGMTVISDEILDDNNEARVTLVDDPKDIDIYIHDIDYYGDGLFLIPITFRSECQLNSAVFKGDFYGLNDERASRIAISELNDHYFDVEEVFDLQIYGSISIQFNSVSIELEQLSEDQLEELSRDAEIGLDSIDDIDIISSIDCAPF